MGNRDVALPGQLDRPGHKLEMLLEKRSMPFAGLPAYVARVPILAELNSRYFRMTPGAMAEWLVNELERAGALRRENDMLYATGS